MMKRLLLAALAAVLFAHGASAKFFIARRHTTTTQTTAVLGQIYHAARLQPTTPLYYCDYTKGALCGIEDWYWRESAAYTYRNASNHLTYGPNNLVLRSADMAADPFTLSRVQAIETDGNSNYILKCSGTGSIAYSGTYSTGSPLDCTAEGEVLMSPTAGTLTLTPTGTTTNVRLVKVLAETTFAARNGVDDVNTGSQPYFGPRVDKNGWLVEGAGNGNIALYSNEFDNAIYSKSNVTLTAAAATSPDGSSNAWLVDPTSTGPNVRQVIQVADNQDVFVTVSLRAKSGTAPWGRLCTNNDAGGGWACGWFNFSTGATAASANWAGREPKAVMTADPYGSGWYQISLTAKMSGRSDVSGCPGGNCIRAEFAPANGSGTWNANIGHTLYAYGFQVRRGGPSSYLPTKAETAGNYGEVADMSDARIAQARAIVFETTYPGEIPSEDDYAILAVNGRGPFGQGVGLSSGGNLNTTWNPVNSQFGAEIVLATTNAVNVGLNRFGVAYDGEHISLAMNGGPVARRAQSTPVPAVFTLATTQIFRNGNSGSPDYPVARCNCYVKSLALYQDLTDAQLKAKTTQGAAP